MIVRSGVVDCNIRLEPVCALCLGAGPESADLGGARASEGGVCDSAHSQSADVTTVHVVPEGYTLRGFGGQFGTDQVGVVCTCFITDFNVVVGTYLERDSFVTYTEQLSTGSCFNQLPK